MQTVRNHGERDRCVLRLIGLCEWIKGVFVLLVASIIVSGTLPTSIHPLFRANLHTSESLLRFLRHVSEDLSPTWLMGFAAGYAVLRCVEGYGLWLERQWAKMLSVISIAFYLPAEVYLQAKHPGWLNFCVIVLNAALMLYMASLLEPKQLLRLSLLLPPTAALRENS